MVLGPLAVQRLRERVGRQVVPVEERPPLALDDRGGVDQRAVEIEEDPGERRRPRLRVGKTIQVRSCGHHDRILPQALAGSTPVTSCTIRLASETAWSA
ncbi:hypothetical protein GCM10020369_68450 [Cryptosporangium minutisporangium]|uniref:Uncharacterized protein n=1 Tax=Cryptosporangium minutisporangium TaxID=113569 RepID=A0ABP6T9Q9_9ACTN